MSTRTIFSRSPERSRAHEASLSAAVGRRGGRAVTILGGRAGTGASLRPVTESSGGRLWIGWFIAGAIGMVAVVGSFVVLPERALLTESSLGSALDMPAAVPPA